MIRGEGGGEVAASPDKSWHHSQGGGQSIHKQLRDDDAAQDAPGGHRLLDASRYRALEDTAGFDEVSSNDSCSSSLYLAIPLKCSLTTTGKDGKAMLLKPHAALQSLKIVVANMSEFVVLLGGCECMTSRPYDTYLYT